MEKQITNNQISIILEEIRSKFDILIEGQMSLDQRLRVIEKDIQTLHKMAEQHSIDIDVMKGLLKDLNKRFEILTNRVERLENENKKEYEQHFERLETRMANIEKLLAQ